MKTKYILKGLLTSIFLILVLASCENYNVDVVDELLVDRVFSPIGVKAIVRNQTNVELNWTVAEGVDHYVVEFSADDVTFNTIYKTLNVAAAQLPITVALEGETTYSVRIKAVSATGLEDSKWVVGKVTTLSEQIFTSIIDGDILATQATLRWIPNSNVTQVTLSPGNISHVITAQEKMDGKATITSLSGETAYTATLWNGTKKRGVLTFTTGIDVGTATLVKVTDDLFQKINEAASGAVLVLEPGNYTAQTGTITLAKSITLRGLRSFDKPKLKVGFSLGTGAANVSLIDLDLNGDTFSEVVKFNDNTNYGRFLISGCTIYDYSKSLFTAANTVLGKIETITVENSIITNINGNGAGTGEFLDFRGAFVGNLTLKSSTFNKCSPTRAFIRADVTTGGLSSTGLIFNILIDSCTLYGVTNTTSASGYQIFYIRFLNNAITVKNSLFAETVARFANQLATSVPAFSNNNYYNAATLNAVNPASPLRSDATGTSLNPGFANAASGDFTISNQTLKDNLVGDPRWIK